MTAFHVLNQLVQAGTSLRRTAIVEDDFPEVMARFDKMLDKAREYLKAAGPVTFPEEVREELASARTQHPRPQASLHEGYAVLAEEVDEVWDIVKQKASRRDHTKLREELVQVAAMAQRMAEEIS